MRGSYTWSKYWGNFDQDNTTSINDQNIFIGSSFIADGPGRPLGRSFGVKLWPTLVFLRDGEHVDQLERPRRVEARAGGEADAHHAGHQDEGGAEDKGLQLH